MNHNRWQHLLKALLSPRIQPDWPAADASVLFVVEGGIGDVVLATPAIQAFQKRHGGSDITVAVQHRAGEVARLIFSNVPVVETDTPEDHEGFRQHLQRDLVWGLRVGLGTSWLVWRTRARVAGWRDWRPAPANRQHETEVMAQICHVTLAPTPAITKTCAPLIVLKPGGKDLRSWPVRHWLQVVDYLSRLGYQVVTVGSASEREDCARVLHGMTPERRDNANLAGKTSPGELLKLLRSATLAIGTDSGVMHLAASVGTSTITLFGPVHPAQFEPRGSSLHLALYRERACSPCQLASCLYPIGSRCMDDIRPDEVIAAVGYALQTSPSTFNNQRKG